VHRRRTTTTVRRASRALAVIVLSTLLLGTIAGFAIARTYRERVFHTINVARRHHDVRPVRVNLRLSRDALQHTRRMIRRKRLYEVRNLTELLRPYDWDRFGGAVVGCASRLRAIHRELMDRAVHRRIILHRAARRVGIGVIRVNGRSSCGRDAFWVTEIFYG
jgi:uncharacterized protein YkwD